MWLQACLNGSRTTAEHSAVPHTPAALAVDALRTLDAGAAALHVHTRDVSGPESLAPDVVAAALTAIREACCLRTTQCLSPTARRERRRIESISCGSE